MRTLGIGITGTCRTNLGIFAELVKLKKVDKQKDEIEWGRLYCYASESGKVCQIAWKDSVLALMLSTVFDGTETVTSYRKRPKQGKKKEDQKHMPFKGEARAWLPIPDGFYFYNTRMGYVDGFDHLTAMNRGDHRFRRGAGQAIEHWVSTTVLVNMHVICQKLMGEDGDLTKFRSQVPFRKLLIAGLLELLLTPEIIPSDASIVLQQFPI